MKRVILALSLCFLFQLQLVHAFTDVDSEDLYGTALLQLKENGKINGYKDGSFKPDNKMNRAEFATMIVRAMYGEPGKEYTKNCFPDVKQSDWYAPYVCLLKEKGYVKGYRDGSFGAGNPINLAEGAKLIGDVFALPIRETKVAEAWFIPYLEQMELYKALPPTFQYIGQSLRRGEVAEVLWRLSSKDASQRSGTVAALSTLPCEPFYEYVPGVSIDFDRVRDTWIGWYNAERSRLGRPLLTRDIRLDVSSISWSETAKQRGYIDHKRGNNVYYDYTRIQAWFRDTFGYTFPQRGNTGYGESIAYNYYNCNSDDCTDQLISAIRSSYDFFLSEKGKSYRPHYDMMVNSNYRKIGLGVVIDKERKRFWLTTHLATDINSKGLPYCQKA